MKNLPNAYCLVYFATCREIKKMSDLEIDKLKEVLDEKRAKERAENIAKELELEETKEDIEIRGKKASVTKTGNFIFLYGCQPGGGVSATTRLVKDAIDLYILHFDPENGTIILPDAYSEIVSSDAKFEVVTPVEAQKLVLERQSDVFGLKKLIMAIDKADMTRKATRNIIIDFFKKFLGFTDADIIFVERTEFGRHKKEGNFQTQFSAETQEAMKKFARAIF